MQIYFITLHSISNSKGQKGRVLCYIRIYKLKVIMILEPPPAKLFPIWSTRLQLANYT